MDRFICIHGHFYQPPRENPWLEAVETQDSAYPYHDWNERIAVECYEPNATSRILDAHDHIVKIVNNYASISFNFGPTLLSWMETGAPQTYASIIDADRVSRERFSGHGNAISQVYNHMIMPLANGRDKRTQVLWGIRDFEYRFGRTPEAMWLPETAVDVTSLEVLAEAGMAFTILEPSQAARTRKIGEKDWVDAKGKIDPTTAYRCNLPSGRSIAIFFYDGPISRAVAFESLLARGETFAHRLIDAFSDSLLKPQLVNIATDGETYGHHHRFGDMALAYAIEYIEQNKLAHITNYAEFLQLHPPTHEVEIVEQTSWSCVHGVERWRSDCGCHTGAGENWNQRWRAPLRQTLDWLRDEVNVIFEREGVKVLQAPWTARDEYIDVVLDRSETSVDAFLSKHMMQGASSVTALKLLEMQRNAMLMFTSCGWFFNDISGIETVQILAYACRVAQLAEDVAGAQLEPGLLSRLAEAQSNIAEQGTARDIYLREVEPARLDLRRVAAHYAVASLFDNFDDDARVHCYDVECRDFDIEKTGRARVAVGSITVRSIITREEASFDFAVLHLGETELTGGVRPASADYDAMKRMLLDTMEPGGIPSIIRLLDVYFAETSVSIRSLFRDAQRRIFNLLCNATLEEAESAFRQLHARYDPLMRFHQRLGIPVPKVLQTAAEFDINVQLRKLIRNEDPPLPEIEALLREAQEERVSLDAPTILAIEHAVNEAAERFHERPDDLDRLENFNELVSIVRSANLRVSMRRSQNYYYQMMRTVRPAIAASSNGSRDAERWLQLFDSLGGRLNVNREAVQ